MSDQPTPGVYFHVDAIESEGKDLVGRRSAGQSFLKGWLRTLEAESPVILVDRGEDEAAAKKAIRALGDDRPITFHHLAGPPTWSQAGAVFFPGPSFLKAAWTRRRAGTKSCSLIGITHTVSTMRVIEGFHKTVAEPVEDWDAIICTSTAVQSVVKRQFEIETQYFKDRFGATRVPLPQLPVIPLGIETADFARQEGERARRRGLYDVGQDDFVVMTMGRWSVIEKANPLPLMLALEFVANQTGKKIHLWMVGWASRKEEEDAIKTAAAKVCRHVTVRLIDGREPDTRRNIWAGADVFTLSVDSIQETFGLVPIEAMAAGVPVVMPDWNGFRDTVKHGETGIRVPTRMAPPGSGADIAARHLDMRDGYLQYLVQVQASVQLDIPYYAQAFLTLMEKPELRAKMGKAAEAHARETYDWSAVIPQYRDLVSDLAARREAGTSTSNAPPPDKGPVSPLEVDPFVAYAEYPTRTIGLNEKLSVRVRPEKELLDLVDEISGRQFAKRAVLNPEIAFKVMDAIRDGADTITALSETLDLAPALAGRIVLHLAKSDFVRIAPIDPRQPPALT